MPYADNNIYSYVKLLDFSQYSLTSRNHGNKTACILDHKNSTASYEDQCNMQRQTMTRTSARSLARNSCNMQSRMFFQPSCNMSLCRWASPKTVRAASCAFALWPNEIGMFSTDCIDTSHKYRMTITACCNSAVRQHVSCSGNWLM